MLIVSFCWKWLDHNKNQIIHELSSRGTNFGEILSHIASKEDQSFRWKYLSFQPSKYMCKRNSKFRRRDGKRFVKLVWQYNSSILAWFVNFLIHTLNLSAFIWKRLHFYDSIAANYCTFSTHCCNYTTADWLFMFMVLNKKKGLKFLNCICLFICWISFEWAVVVYGTFFNLNNVFVLI